MAQKASRGCFREPCNNRLNITVLYHYASGYSRVLKLYPTLHFAVGAGFASFLGCQSVLRATPGFFAQPGVLDYRSSKLDRLNLNILFLVDAFVIAGGCRRVVPGSTPYKCFHSSDNVGHSWVPWSSLWHSSALNPTPFPGATFHVPAHPRYPLCFRQVLPYLWWI